MKVHCAPDLEEPADLEEPVKVHCAPDLGEPADLKEPVKVHSAPDLEGPATFRMERSLEGPMGSHPHVQERFHQKTIQSGSTVAETHALTSPHASTLQTPASGLLYPYPFHFHPFQELSQNGYLYLHPARLVLPRYDDHYSDLCTILLHQTQNNLSFHLPV